MKKKQKNNNKKTTTTKQNKNTHTHTQQMPAKYIQGSLPTLTLFSTSSKHFNFEVQVIHINDELDMSCKALHSVFYS